jgi:hypothetical protein
MLVVEKERSMHNKGGLFDLNSQQLFSQQPTIKLEQMQPYNVYTNEAN